MTSDRTRLTFEFLWLAISTAAFQASRMGTGILAAAFLQPSDYAEWGLVLAILGYSVYLNLGIASGLNRDLPRLLGAERPREAQLLEQAALGGTIGASLLVVPAVIVLALPVGLSLPALALTALAAGIQQYYLFTQTILRSRLHFNRASLQQAALAVAFPIIALPLIGRMGVAALILAQGVTFGLGAVFARGLGLPLRPRFDRGEIVAIIRVGIPIMAAGLAFAVLTTADRWLTLLLLGEQATGQYTFAALLTSSALLVSVVLAQQFYPRMAMALGRGERMRSLLAMATRQTLAVTALVAPLTLVLVFVAPIALEAWLPEYLPATPAIRVLAVGFLVLVAASGFTNLLVVIGLANVYLAILVMAMAIDVIAALALAGMGLVGMAIAALAAYVFVLATSVAVAVRVGRR